jgi:glycosyltransferase involved in cell wall biosynthesis
MIRAGRVRARKQKLLVLLSSQFRGGCEEHALTVAREAVARSWDVHVAFPYCEGTRSLAEDFAAQGVAYRPLRIEEKPGGEAPKRKHLGRLFRTLWRLWQVRPTGVLVNLADPTHGMAVLLACALLKVPTTVVFQLAPITFWVAPRKASLMRWARGRSQRWVSVSDHNRKMVSQSFGAADHDITVIHNGVTLVAAAADAGAGFARLEARESVRAELGIPAEARLVVSVGRLHRQKGFDVLIAAVPFVIRECADVWFVLVGEGPERAALEKQARELGVLDRVRMPGYRTDVPRFLLAGDLFAFPSRFEGLPFALLEAMAHGVPTVAADATSTPEIIADRSHGLLFPSGDHQKLYEALVWALGHREEMACMAERAAERTQDFTEQKMLRRTLDWFEGAPG